MREVQAIVTSVSDRIEARVRRGNRSEGVQGAPIGLRYGDRIIVGRRVNNPYLVFIRKA